MKISGKVIQERNIVEHSDTTFYATYKGKSIHVCSEHKLGDPIYKHLTRYNITVTDNRTGVYDVFTYGDYHTMIDAIRYAMKGACLL